MITVLHITEVASGGVLPMIANICNGLADEYHIIVAYGIRPDTPANIREYFDDRIRLIPVSSFKREISIKDDIKAMKIINDIVKRYDPDIVHMHSTKAGLLGRIALLPYKGKKFYTPHGYSFLKKDDPKFKTVLYKIAEFLLAHTGCITVACGRGEWNYARQLKKDAVCINNGIDTAWIDSILHETEKKEHDFTVYTAGRIGPQKNPRLFDHIAKCCPDIRFVWIGEGEEAGYLTSPNITVTGLVDRESLLEMAVNFDCYLSCALWEGLPVALLEAMYLKKECIVSRIAGHLDLIEDGQTGLIAYDSNDYIELIGRVRFGNTRYGKYAHEKVLKEYGMKNMCEGYRKLYTALK